jgi:hypothetical protein
VTVCSAVVRVVQTMSLSALQVAQHRGHAVVVAALQSAGAS